MKKAGFVASTAVGLMLVGGTAFAAPADSVAVVDDDSVTYADAARWFMDGGGAAGYGAAALVAGAYTGIALTPALVAGSFSD
ncbi:MAG: hypothetical protein ACRDQW_03690 [Haloechinothrix sp.]